MVTTHTNVLMHTDSVANRNTYVRKSILGVLAVEELVDIVQACGARAGVAEERFRSDASFSFENRG